MKYRLLMSDISTSLSRSQILCDLLKTRLLQASRQCMELETIRATHSNLTNLEKEDIKRFIEKKAKEIEQLLLPLQ